MLPGRRLSLLSGRWALGGDLRCLCLMRMSCRLFHIRGRYALHSAQANPYSWDENGWWFWLDQASQSLSASSTSLLIQTLKSHDLRTASFGLVQLRTTLFRPSGQRFWLPNSPHKNPKSVCRSKPQRATAGIN